MSEQIIGNYWTDMEKKLEWHSNHTLEQRNIEQIELPSSGLRPLDEYQPKDNGSYSMKVKICSNIEREFLNQHFQQFRLFQIKNENYGMKNIRDDGESKLESLQALYFRMRDKMARFKQLIENNSDGTNDESLEDTLNDLANYSNIAIIVNKEEWK